MSDFQVIEQKLSEFKKKFYLSDLLRGGIFFLAIGALYFLLTAWVEELLWLPKPLRALMFWVFVLVEVGLWFYWIWPALSVLFGIKAPMSNQEAAQIIGTQIPEVGDRLTNTLDLLKQEQDTELILASIAQKSKTLSPFYFNQAIDLKDNIKHLRWIILPVSVLILIWAFGDLSSLFEGYNRVAAYNQEFVRPTPYHLTFLNEELKARSNQEIRLRIEAKGAVLPNEVFAVVGDQRQTMAPRGFGQFELVIPPQKTSFEVYFGTDQYRSQNYPFEIVYGPEIKGFSVEILPPSYTRMRQQRVENTGNFRALSGSKILWKINTEYTEQIRWANKTDTLYFKSDVIDGFSLTKTVFGDEQYDLSLMNNQVGFEPGVAYNIEVYPDERPKILVETQSDTINSVAHHKVLAWDDFLVSKIEVVCYAKEDPKNQRRLRLDVVSGANTQTLYTFPNGFELIKGKAYQYYFEAWDNDGVLGAKSARSNVFSHQESTILEAQEKLLSQQNEQTNQIEKALKSLEEQNNQVEEIEQSRRQKETVNWQDERSLERLLEKQQQQLDNLEQQTEALKNTLERFNENQRDEDGQADELMERLEEQLESLKEQSDKWEELRELQEQLQEEDLLEELSQNQQQQKAQEQNLARLVEMTRRFFVTQKMNQISNQLKELGERQEKLAQDQSDEKTLSEKQQQQAQLNKEFEAIKKALDLLEQENEKLKQPMSLPRDPGGEMDIAAEQQKATESLKQGETPQAQESQKQAGQKMQEMAQKLGAEMQQMQQQAMQEDTQMLRQVLDNLIVFSLAQEGHMNLGQKRQLGGWSMPEYINKQNDLRDNFNHIDDSLYALSMRQPMITAKVNQSLSQASYYLGKSLEDLAETRFSSAAVAQQFVFTQANDLANLLDGVVSQMEQMSMSMPGAGSGQGSGSQGFQLQDIIQQQQSLQDQGENKGEQGQQSGEGSSQGGKTGKDGTQGESDQQGGQEGAQQGKGGQSGRDGQNKPQGEGNNGQNGNKEGSYKDTDAERAARYSIYKAQQQLRQELEDRLRKQGLLDLNQGVLQKMEENAQEVLRNGITNRAKALMKEIDYQLMKLEEAQYEQQKEQKRESQTNTRRYDPALNNPWQDERRYFDQLDILIKDALPLQPYYKKQAERYFKIRNQANDQF